MYRYIVPAKLLTAGTERTHQTTGKHHHVLVVVESEPHYTAHLSNTIDVVCGTITRLGFSAIRRRIGSIQ